MDTQQSSTTTTLPEPLRTAASVLRRVPGAGMMGRAAEGALDKVGAVSPRGRRIAVYTGAGGLGVAGVVEWPVAVTGAAVAWLTQQRPKETDTTVGRAEPESSDAGGGTAASLAKASRTQKKTTAGRGKPAGRGGMKAQRPSIG
jgi:hypothetical protein